MHHMFHMNYGWLIALALLSGCVSGATGRRQLLLVSESQEVSLGAKAFDEIRSKEKTCGDATARAAILAIGQRIAAVSPKPKWAWVFELFDAADTLNAFALPGGKVGIYSGLLPAAKTSAGLAAVVGHEIDIPPLTPAKFDPLGIFLTYPFVIATSGDAPYSTMAELASYAGENDVALGHFGDVLTPTQVTKAYAKTAGFEFASDAAFDALDCNTLASGDADVINTTLQLILPCLDSVKVLVSITDQRIPLIPETPTIGELEPSLDIALWNGLFVTKDTPQDVRDKIIAVASKTAMSERAQNVAKETGALVYWQNADDSAARIAKDIDTVSRIGELLE